MNIAKSAAKNKPANTKQMEEAERKFDFPVCFHWE
jgi:hypothetical protein